jgi:hypothetical protein
VEKRRIPTQKKGQIQQQKKNKKKEQTTIKKSSKMRSAIHMQQ